MTQRDDGWRVIGRIAALYRHPIKSMAAQPLQSAALDRSGIAWDRRFALRRRADASGFPWHTAGKLPALVRYSVESLDDRGRPERIRTPDGETIGCDPATISNHFAEAHGVDVELMHLTQGMFDCAGVSIITLQTLASLESLIGMSLDGAALSPEHSDQCGCESRGVSRGRMGRSRNRAWRAGDRRSRGSHGTRSSGAR